MALSADFQGLSCQFRSSQIQSVTNAKLVPTVVATPHPPRPRTQPRPEQNHPKPRKHNEPVKSPSGYCRIDTVGRVRLRGQQLRCGRDAKRGGGVAGLRAARTQPVRGRLLRRSRPGLLPMCECTHHNAWPLHSPRARARALSTPPRGAPFADPRLFRTVPACHSASHLRNYQGC